MQPRIPPYSRVKQLSRLLDLPAPRVLKEACRRHRRSLYLKADDRWFRFRSPTDVIVPYTTAETIARKAGIDIELDPMQPSLSTPRSLASVVIVGHFNHGKTTLFDRLTGSRFVEQESHGITQVVRTRTVSLSPSVSGTFIDTPGQDIFYRMRNTGAAVADVAMLVVAADQGVCEQTKESIGIVESLGLPVVVCVNKIDVAEVVSQPSLLTHLEHELREYVALEHAPIVRISALTGLNLDVLRAELLRRVTALGGIGPVSAEEVESEKRGSRPCGSGTALNVWRDRHHGTVMHMVLRAGRVRVKDVFSGGGWWELT